MPEITIGTAAEAGVHVATLRKVNGPKVINTRDGEAEIYEWEFVLPDGSPIQGSTSTATGPQSKLYKWIAALNNGRGLAPGERLELNDYAGRRAIITIEINDKGYPKIVAMSAIPVSMQQEDFAAATGAPVRQAAPQPIRPQAPAHPAAQPPAAVSPLRAVPPAPVAAASAPADDLPF